MMKKEQVILFFAVLLLAIGAPSQTVDVTYAPSATKPTNITGSVRLMALPGGKILAHIANEGVNTVKRINADGSFDPSFNCTACPSVFSMTLQPDGKYLLAGFNPVSTAPDLVRLNLDGSIDTTFTSGLSLSSSRADVFAVTPDGKVYAFAVVSNIGTLYRLNPDGSVDNTFSPISYGTWDDQERNSIRQIIVQPNGQILVANLGSSHGAIYRANSDGTKDPTWNVPILVASDFPNPPGIFSMILQPDGKVVVSGNFFKINGLDRNNVARLNPDSSVDSATAGNIGFAVNGVFLQPFSNGEILYKGGVDFRRMSADLATDVFLFQGAAFFTVDSNDKIVYLANGTLHRGNPDGSLDPTFNFLYPNPAKVGAVALQADGKAIVVGLFDSLNGTPRPGIGRLNADGTTDTSFAVATGFRSNSDPSEATKLIVQPDGKILAYGPFNQYTGVARQNLARINPDGSLDTAFNPIFSDVTSIEAQPDGKILLLGTNIGVNGFARTGVARLNNDGSVDAAFNPQIEAPNISGAVVHADGKITIAGAFSSVNGINRSNLARLNADGTLDTTLDAENIGRLLRIALYPNGKYIVTRYGGTAVYRLNSDGTIDPSFTSPTIIASEVRTILPEASGSVILGGIFTSPGSRILKLKANGSLDNPFLLGGANGTVLGLAKQADGKVLAVGEFRIIGSVSKPSIARISLLAKNLYDFDGDGKADPSVTRLSDYYWHQLSTAGGYTYSATHFGQAGDKIVPGDYDGDSKADIAIWRPSTGEWWWRASSTGTMAVMNIGESGNTPMPFDSDGDGKADLVTVTPGGLWKGVNTSGQIIVWHQFGQAGDKPVIGDFDGDRKYDMAYFRPSNGTWYYNKSSSGNNLEVGTIQWGLGTDIPVSGDYDGDRITDVAVFRPSEGNWYVLQSGGGFIMLHFGATGDKPIAADYDGDGKTDIAVYRPSEGFWYELLSTGGYTGYPWGNSIDIPTPNALLPAADPPRPSNRKR